MNAFSCSVQLLWGPDVRLNNYQVLYSAVSLTARILLWLAITNVHTFLQHVFLEIQENSCLYVLGTKSVLRSFDFKVRMSVYLCLNLCISMSKSWSPQAEAAVKQLIPAAWKPHLGIVRDSVLFQVGGICLKFIRNAPMRAFHLSLINQMRIQFLPLIFFFFLFHGILTGYTRLKYLFPF